MNKKFYIETWGCQMNEEDSEKLSGMLKGKGYQATDELKEADLVIYNTCCVRENAEQKVYGNIGILKKYKKENKDLIIAVTGCMMQQEGMAEKIRRKFPYVDIIIGTFNSYKFIEYLDKVLKSRKKITEIQEKQEEITEGIPIDRKSSVKAFVTIMYGCDNFCTYCIVPYVRGRERSRKPEDIEAEIKTLVTKGYKEITLLGQNVNSYGKGLNPSISFSDLLRRIDKVEGLERIRFMTSHPKDLTIDVIQAIKECPKVCEQVHIPVQSGSSRILKLMNRKYDREHYLSTIKMIRENIKDVTLTTDIIIGFPGETEEDFSETLSLCREAEFDSAFTFLYSKREGTKAAEYDNQISDKTMHDRFNRLVDTINTISERKNKEYQGKTYEVLAEGKSKNDEKTLTGRTRGGKLVNFIGSEDSIGKLVKVKITEAKSFSLFGEEV
ncbi:MAG: tRNA (N6-isopentenyl adenosine(37)-C2)-methylthiotransferase MiaB [Bacillota bacterium]|nr:tRNA (N6-isopentenyl adenosine(37)-C2)-methylthiotransferase MiaB [Bacillota bacterium]